MLTNLFLPFANIMEKLFPKPISCVAFYSSLHWRTYTYQLYFRIFINIAMPLNLEVEIEELIESKQFHWVRGKNLGVYLFISLA